MFVRVRVRRLIAGSFRGYVPCPLAGMPASYLTTRLVPMVMVPPQESLGSKRGGREGPAALAALLRNLANNPRKLQTIQGIKRFGVNLWVLSQAHRTCPGILRASYAPTLLQLRQELALAARRRPHRGPALLLHHEDAENDWLGRVRSPLR